MCLAGDGRGTHRAYTATYLAAVASGFSLRRGVGAVDVVAALFTAPSRSNQGGA